MKRVTIIFLSVFYLMIASGLSFSLHYCGGKLKSISLYASAEKTCCGSKKKSKGCCKDKTTLLKVEDSHQLVKVAKVTTPTVKYVHSFSVQLLFNVFPADLNTDSDFHLPPVLYDNPLYLKHRVLII